MAGDPRIPATAPTTQAAPKLGRSIAAIVPPLEAASKFLRGLLPSNLVAVAGFADASRLLPASVLWRPLMPMLAMGSGQPRDPRLVGRSSYLREINAPPRPKCLFYRFTGCKALFDGVALHATVSCPLRERFGAPVDSKLAVAFPIVHLFFACRPFAIFGRVGAVIVDAFKGHPLRWRSHISEEALKLHPPVADRDSTSSVSMEGVIVRIKAPLFHAAPSVVTRRTAQAVRHIRDVERIRPPRGSALMFAAAGNRVPAAKMVPTHDLCHSAIAANKPVVASAFAVLNSQQSELLSKHFGHCVALPHSRKERNHAV